MARYVWGVDSAVPVTPDLLACVKENYGAPAFWGRYLTRVPNSSEGLTIKEITFLKNNKIKILPIYNKFTEAVGYREGVVVAKNAAFHATRLGCPKGTVLFANLEKSFNVDAEWIKGWVEGMYTSGFKSGLYFDPVHGDFNEAFCKAVQENKKVRVQTVLWSAEPETGISSKSKAPKFHPQTPDCSSNVWGWQYGRDAKTCPIDTNLADTRVLSSLW